MTGFIKIHRKINEWEWYQDKNVFRVFMHLLLTANFKDQKFRGLDIKRGQLVVGRTELAKSTTLSEQEVRTALTKLKSTNEIAIKTTNKFSVITLVNYGFYQDNDIKINQQSTNNQPTINQQSTTRERRKEGKKYFGIDKSIPQYLDRKLWCDFMETRDKAKSAKTENALDLVLEKLESFRLQGYDPNESLKQSIVNGWKGVFEPKQTSRTKQKQLHNNFKNQNYEKGTGGFQLD
jgi:hypothetical protein